jgi:hypothetical protein
MKRILIVYFLLVPVITNAQRFKGGTVVGFNVSQIDGDFWAGYNKAGLVGGAFVYTEFRDHWGSQMEIRYAAKGSATSLNNPVHRKIRLQYIELPLLATYDFFSRFQAQGGVSVGYLFSAAQNEGNGYEEFDQFDQFEFALDVGVNYKIFEKLSANVRFSYSILPIYALYSGATLPYAMFNNVLTFAVYYRIGQK